jgi:hypothetical protein
MGLHLVARQLTALARLGALCHFDLDLVGVGQVVRRDAEPTGSHLLATKFNFISENADGVVYRSYHPLV